MKYPVAILFTFGLFGCTVACDVSKSVSSLVSAQIAVQLTCKNIDAVKASVDEQLKKLKVCEAKPVPTGISPSSAVGSFVCAPLVNALAAGAVGQLPVEWGCTGGTLTDSIKIQLIAACEKAI